MPSPESEIGSTWATATAGRNASTAPFGHRDAERVDGAVHRDEHRHLVGDRGHEHAAAAWPGLAAHAVDADVHRADEAHPVLRAWRSGRRGAGCRRRRGSRPGRRPWRAAMTSAIHAWSSSSSDGSSAKPTNVRSGSATKPLSRSMTTDANAMSPAPVVFGGPADAQDVAADGRRQHVAHELAGEVVPEQRAQRDVDVEHREHPLPAPRREHEPDEGEARARRRGTPACRCGCPSAGRRRRGSW